MLSFEIREKRSCWPNPALSCVLQTLADLARQPTASEGYVLLRERGMLDMSAEAVVLRFPDRFGPDVLIAARRRLDGDPDPNPDGEPN